MDPRQRSRRLVDRSRSLAPVTGPVTGPVNGPVTGPGHWPRSLAPVTGPGHWPRSLARLRPPPRRPYQVEPSSMPPPVLHSLDPRGVASVTLNRPEVGNAYNGDMIEGLLAAMDALSARPELRALMLKGNGKHFQA